MNYRKIYGYENIPEGWDVHHIDWDRSNNDITNLIAVPKILHKILHDYSFLIGMVYFDERKFLKERDVITNLVKIYKRNSSKQEKKVKEKLLNEIDNLFSIEEKKSKGNTKLNKGEWGKLKKIYSHQEILKGRDDYPEGEMGDQIFKYIFEEENNLF